jgi:flagellar protein FliT
MLSEKQTLDVYENVLSLTGQMLEAARLRDWEKMTQLELHCTEYVDVLKEKGSISTLNGELREKKVQLLQGILKNDRAIRDITHPWMNELSALIHTLTSQRKLELAYPDSDPY